LDEDQVTLGSVASFGFTVAERASVVPLTSVKLVLFNSTEETGITLLLTVTTHVAEKPPDDAVTVDIPSAIAVTIPEEETVATDCLDEAQKTVLSVASLGSTVALSWTDSPMSISAVA